MELPIVQNATTIMQTDTTINKRYFVNAPVDFIFIGGSSIVLFFALSFFYTDMRTQEVVTAAVFLSWLINWPHFSMSTYRLYQSRSNIRQYPVTAYVIPFIVLGGLGLSFNYPDVVAPYYVKLFLLWSPYHFSGQTIGITMIYAMRCGIKLSPLERRVITWFVIGTYLLSTIRAEVSRKGHSFYGVNYPSMQIPQWVANMAEIGMWCALAAFIGILIYWSVRHKRILPWIVVLPPATQYLWFVQSMYMPSFQEFVPLLHSLQYMLIAWGIQLKEKMDVKQIQPSKKYAITETARWFAVNFAGGALLFYFLPKLGVISGHTAMFSIAIVYSAIQIHHFFVDGVIWKLRNTSVSHPLMMNISDITGAGPKSTRTQEFAV